MLLAPLPVQELVFQTHLLIHCLMTKREEQRLAFNLIKVLAAFLNLRLSTEPRSRRCSCNLPCRCNREAFCANAERRMWVLIISIFREGVFIA